MSQSLRSLSLGAACLLLASGGLLRAQDDGLHWFDNYSDALQEARKTGKPIFLEYRCEP